MDGLFRSILNWNHILQDWCPHVFYHFPYHDHQTNSSLAQIYHYEPLDSTLSICKFCYSQTLDTNRKKSKFQEAICSPYWFQNQSQASWVSHISCCNYQVLWIASFDCRSASGPESTVWYTAYLFVCSHQSCSVFCSRQCTSESSYINAQYHHLPRSVER